MKVSLLVQKCIGIGVPQGFGKPRSLTNLCRIPDIFQTVYGAFREALRYGEMSVQEFVQAFGSSQLTNWAVGDILGHKD